jgi:hypothetical protein
LANAYLHSDKPRKHGKKKENTMAMTRKEEARALDADERDLVERTHHPDIQSLPDAELPKLVRLVRERRDKARDQASRQRREMRGKGAPKGARPAADNAGTKTKLAVLAMAMRRLNNEAERRRRLAARSDLAENARRALALKNAGADQKGADFNSRTAHRGMRNVQNEKARSLVRPMELGRQRKAASVAQAKRDAR